MLCLAVQQFYRETMEVSDEVKSDSAVDIKDSKSTSLDNSATEDVAAVTDTNDVDMKMEEGWLLVFFAVLTEMLLILIWFYLIFYVA